MKPNQIRLGFCFYMLLSSNGRTKIFQVLDTGSTPVRSSRKKRKENKFDKESIYLLQKIDCNCNDCLYLIRDIEKYKSYDYLWIENRRVTNPSYRPLYGNCSKLNKPVCFLANTCQIDTQECFKHRKDKL